MSVAKSPRSSRNIPASQGNSDVAHDAIQQHLTDKQRTYHRSASRLYPRHRRNPAAPYSWQDMYSTESNVPSTPASDQLRGDLQWQYHDGWNHMVPVSAAVDQQRYFAPVTSYPAGGPHPSHNWQSSHHAQQSDGPFHSGHGYSRQRWDEVSEWTPVVSRGQRHGQFHNEHGYSGQQCDQVSEWTRVVSRGQRHYRQHPRHRRSYQQHFH